MFDKFLGMQYSLFFIQIESFSQNFIKFTLLELFLPPKKCLKYFDRKILILSFFLSFFFSTLTFSYILFGAIMFQRWDDSWNLLTGCYFCFISLSSIGFGDIIPGDKVTKKEKDLWLLWFDDISQINDAY